MQGREDREANVVDRDTLWKSYLHLSPSTPQCAVQSAGLGLCDLQGLITWCLHLKGSPLFNFIDFVYLMASKTLVLTGWLLPGEQDNHHCTKACSKVNIDQAGLAASCLAGTPRCAARFSSRNCSGGDQPRLKPGTTERVRQEQSREQCGILQFPRHKQLCWLPTNRKSCACKSLSDQCMHYWF